MKVVLDTNIFISGIFWKGESNKILLLWKKGKIELITSLDMISELIKVLKHFKIRLPDDLIQEWVSLIIRNAIIVESSEKIDIIKEDPSDNKFIEAAITGNADYIISQDRHLLKIKKYKSIKIIKPDEFNKMLK